MLKFELVEIGEQWVHPDEIQDTYVNPEYPDLYMADGSCYVWFQFENASHDLTEIYLTPIGFIKLGHWLDSEASTDGLEMVFGVDGWKNGAWLDFALQNGLYLFQPFLVAFDKPDWHRCNSYYDPEEWDVNYSWEIIYREEPTPEMVAETVKFLGEVLEQ